MSRLRGLLWLTAGLVVAFVAAVVAYMTLSRAAEVASGQVMVEGDTRPVVVMVQRVPVGSALTAADVTTMDLAVEAIPDDAATEIDEVVDMVTLVDLYPGEVVLLPRLVDPNVTSADGRIALALAEEQVLMAVPASDLMSTVSVLKPGDHVDIFVSMVFPVEEYVAYGDTAGTSASTGEDDKMVTFILLQNVTIAGLPGVDLAAAEEGGEIGNPQALLLTLSPQDALVLKYALDDGAIQDIVLRAPGADQEWSIDPVDVDYVIDAFEIPVQ